MEKQLQLRIAKNKNNTNHNVTEVMTTILYALMCCNCIPT